MRKCRYRQCGQSFWPAQPNYYFCSWACHQAHYAETGNDYRGYQRSRDEHYDRGFWDGARARPAELGIPLGIWRGLLQLAHPDKWQDEPELVSLSAEVTRWLLAHRPQG